MKTQPKTSDEATGLAAVEAYLAAVPEPSRAMLLQIRAAIRAAVPAEAVECISYGVPAFRLGQGVAGYAAGKNFLSYYPMSGRVITALREELAAYEATSGSVHFPLDEPLPVDLIGKLVAARLKELEKKRVSELAHISNG
jgi:uncharacterized protein YdhG (YjbR/CyaY superfamily)